MAAPQSPLNASPSPTPFLRWTTWLWRRIYGILAAIVLIGLTIPVLLRHHLEWERVYVPAARALLHGQDIFSVAGYVYPPFSALFQIPFALLPVIPARLVFVGLLSFCFIYYIRRSWGLSSGRATPRPGADPVSEHVIFILGLACALGPALNTFTHLQTDLIIAALMTAGCARMARGRFMESGVWIGLAAAFKGTPLLFAPYLLWRRKFLAAALLLAVAVGANLLPDAIARPPGGGWWLERWTQQYLRPLVRSDYDPGNWNNGLNNNQSLWAAVRRWFATDLGNAAQDYNAVDRPDRIDVAKLRWISLLAATALLLPVAVVIWLRRPGPNAAPPRQLMLECSIVMLLMLIFSPNSSRGHFLILLLPAFCVARFASERRDLPTRILLALAVVCSILALRVAATSHAEQILHWVGIEMASAIFLLAACLVVLMRQFGPDHSINIASP